MLWATGVPRLTINLIADKSGPTTSSVSAAPNPNNGTVGVNSSTPAVRLTALLTDTLSKISAAEGFIDAVGANGAGFPMVAADGLFNSSIETGTVDIPLSTIVTLSIGNHTLYVHGKDCFGELGRDEHDDLAYRQDGADVQQF